MKVELIDDGRGNFRLRGDPQFFGWLALAAPAGRDRTGTPTAECEATGTTITLEPDQPLVVDRPRNPAGNLDRATPAGLDRAAGRKPAATRRPPRRRKAT